MLAAMWMRRLTFAPLALLLALPALAWAAPCAQPDLSTRVTGLDECLIVKSFGPAEASPANRLIVLLHGNHSDGSPATSMVRYAERLARQAPDVVAVAMIRPGYDDETGQRSSGAIHGRGDNFTALNIDIIADAIARLKAHYRPQRVVLIGHSGGAATAGVILGRHPGLADAAVLVGCPCDVPVWRAGRGRNETAWTSESPDRYVARIPEGTRVGVIVGVGDTVTPPALSKNYAADLAKRGIATELMLLDGLDHYNVIGDGRVLATALRYGAAEPR
ncbi:MAG: alpha/beta fold hydrolase [Rhodospirillales bacterium]|nr:alpha/beta fold hydrolase [Rhodospirillales bacterium]